MIEQRRTKRFEMELPVEIIRTGSDQVSETVEYVVTLASGNNGVVHLRCMGKVLRLETFPSEESEAPSVVVAVSLERYEFQRFKEKSLSHAEVA